MDDKSGSNPLYMQSCGYALSCHDWVFKSCHTTIENIRAFAAVLEPSNNLYPSPNFAIQLLDENMGVLYAGGAWFL